MGRKKMEKNGEKWRKMEKNRYVFGKKREKKRKMEKNAEHF